MGRAGSCVAFTEPTALRSNVREAGEEIARGEVAIQAGEVIRAARGRLHRKLWHHGGSGLSSPQGGHHLDRQ